MSLNIRRLQVSSGYSPIGSQSGPVTLTPLPIHSTLVYDGDSNMQGVNGITLMHFALSFAQGTAVPIVGANKALAGDTTAKCLANLQAVLNTNAKIYVCGVGRNDLYSITTEANKASKLAAAKANIQAIWDAVLDDSTTMERVCHLTLVPVSANYENWDELRQSAWLELDDWIRSRHGSMNGRVHIADIKPAGWDSNTDYYTDRQHLGYRGSYKGGKLIGPVLRNIMEDVEPYYTDPGDFGSILPASAASLAGTGGSIWSVSSESVSGQVANGCVVGLGSGGTRGVNVEGVSVVCSKEIDQDGYNVQRVDVTAEAGAPSFELYFLVAVGSGSYTNATRYYSYMRGQMENVTNIERFDGGTWSYTGTTSYNANQAYASYAYTPVSTAGLGIGDIDEADVAMCAGLANTGGNMTRLWAVARVVFMAGGGGGTFRFSRPTIRPFTVAESS